MYLFVVNFYFFKRRTGTVVPKLQGAVDFKKYLNFTWHRTISKMFFARFFLLPAMRRMDAVESFDFLVKKDAVRCP